MSSAVALSIRQPWATLVAAGCKTIEVRSWSVRFRGRFLIHAARVPDPRPEAWSWVTDELRPCTDLRGGIIGAAEVVDCVRYPTLAAFARDAGRHLCAPDWFREPMLFGLVLTGAARLPFRRLKGNTRFFSVKESGH
jgi:hypothetical protein